ncbi:MAG: hypothetical protein HQL29_01170 [Candidatus Omnitrophica bacterium]|nr:hypothetical protein [Candidatus Omnitrophota bacterium]
MFIYTFAVSDAKTPEISDSATSTTIDPASSSEVIIEDQLTDLTEAEGEEALLEEEADLEEDKKDDKKKDEEEIELSSKNYFIRYLIAVKVLPQSINLDSKILSIV